MTTQPTPQTDSFEGKVVWLIGATGTLGAATAQLLAQRGATLAISARDAVKLEAVAGSIAPKPLVVPVDLKSEASVVAAAEAIARDLGRISCLAVSVSVPAFGEFLMLPDSAFADAMDTKYMGSLRAIRAVLPGMLEQAYGRIVVLSGGGGTFPRPVHLPGGGANAALELVARGLAKRYVNEGIRVNVVAPGPIKSPRMRAIVEASNAAGQSDGKVPVGEPQDVAEAVCYLLSSRSEFINGDVLRVDGGAR
jgi:3-oxoacyl-[acyl-carrier protein] reductase